MGVYLIADPFAQLAGATGATGAITEVAARQLLAVARTPNPGLFQFATGSALVANAQNIHVAFMTPGVVVRAVTTASTMEDRFEPQPVLKATDTRLQSQNGWCFHHERQSEARLGSCALAASSSGCSWLLALERGGRNIDACGFILQ